MYLVTETLQLLRYSGQQFAGLGERLLKLYLAFCVGCYQCLCSAVCPLDGLCYIQPYKCRLSASLIVLLTYVQYISIKSSEKLRPVSERLLKLYFAFCVGCYQCLCSAVCALNGLCYIQQYRCVSKMHTHQSNFDLDLQTLTNSCLKIGRPDAFHWERVTGWRPGCSMYI